MDMNLLAYNGLDYLDCYFDYDCCCYWQCPDGRVCACRDPQRRCGLIVPDPRLWYLRVLWRVDGDADEAPRAGSVSVPLLTYAVAAVFAAALAMAAAGVVAALSTPTTAAKTPLAVDANPPTAAQAVAASDRYCQVEREPRFANQSDAIAS